METESPSPRPRRCKCIICKKLFDPDPRNRGRQKACSEADCQKERKALSQRRWLSKPENRDYFRGPENVRRVQQWRRNNPGRKPARGPRKAPSALQDASNGEVLDGQEVKASLTQDALQDALSTQHVIFTGLISLLTGSALQDDIDSFSRRLIDQGRNVRGMHSAFRAPEPSTPSKPP